MIRFSVELHPSVGENLCPRSCWRDWIIGARSKDSTLVIVGAPTSVIEPEEGAFELVNETPCIDATLCVVKSSICS